MRATKTRLGVALVVALALAAGPALGLGPADPTPPMPWSTLWTAFVDALTSLAGADSESSAACSEGEDCGEIGPAIDPNGLAGSAGCADDAACGELGPGIDPDGLTAHE